MEEFVFGDDFETDLNELLDICSEFAPIQKNGSFIVDSAKPAILEMINYVVKDNSESAALIDWLDQTDFWAAPASTRFHGNVKGGLAFHTFKVIEQCLIFAKPILENFYKSPLAKEYNISVADIFIAALAHDFCKTNFYGVEYRNAKDISGNWIKQPFYKTKSDNRNLGHGNESFLILLKILPSYINNRPVIEAISRHMGFSDLSESEGYNYSLFLQNPLVILLQLADQTAAQWFNA